MEGNGWNSHALQMIHIVSKEKKEKEKEEKEGTIQRKENVRLVKRAVIYFVSFCE